MMREKEMQFKFNHWEKESLMIFENEKLLDETNTKLNTAEIILLFLLCNT